MSDDRSDFDDQRIRHLQRLAADQALHRAAIELFAAADRHHYSYVWDWLGLPIIQTPTDIVAVQEVIWRCRPDVVVETGVARGGSVVLYASIFELLGHGDVIAVDIDIRPHNREMITRHPLSHRISLVEGSSTSESTVSAVRQLIPRDAAVMIVLDSNHTREHVLRELELYSPLVTPGQYLIAADTIVEYLQPNPERPRPWGRGNNPLTAVEAFLSENDAFERDTVLDAKLLLSSSRGGYLRRKAPA